MRKGISCALICALVVLALGGGGTLVHLLNKIDHLEMELLENEHLYTEEMNQLQLQINRLQWEKSGSETSTQFFAKALRAGEIKSVLILGDSITDGNGDSFWVSDQSRREELECRFIIEDHYGKYYENVSQGQGWVKYFRNHLLTYTSVEIVDNNAIGRKSAKWGNAYKEQWIPEGYDAIIVMLGTNDRWDCESIEEFYSEYSQLLQYANDRAEVCMVVMTPIPTLLDEQNEAGYIDALHIADAVLDICYTNGYECINLFNGLQEMAHTTGRTLDEYYFGGVHPSDTGYLAIYRLIMLKLGLNLNVDELYDINQMDPVRYIGVNREDITEETGLWDCSSDGKLFFPEGRAVYYTTKQFTASEPYGGTVVTLHRENGTGEQIFKPYYVGYDLIRYSNEGGNWTQWFTVNRDQFYREDG